MLHTRIHRIVLLSSLLLAPALALQRPAPAPAPAAQDQAKREERARQQAESEAKAREEREKAERERVQKARERAKGNEAAAQPGAEQNNAAREAARNLFALERVHRERLGRIERLMELFREKGDEAKLLELEQMRAKENKRYARFLERYKEEMGPAFAQVEPSLRAGQVRQKREKGAKEAGAPPRAREEKPSERKPHEKKEGGR